MLTHKQGVFLSKLLTIGPFLALYAAVTFVCMDFSLGWASTIQDFGPDVWPSFPLYFVVLGDLAALVRVYFFSLRTFRGLKPLGRFYLLMTAALLGLLALNYASFVVANNLAGGMLSLL